MKLHFDPNQPFQHDAINSIVGIFEGQSLNQGDFSFAISSENYMFREGGVGNRLEISKAQLQQHLEPLEENAKTEDVLYELLLKSGVALTAKIEEKEGFFLANNNEIALILETINTEIIKAVIGVKPQKVITLDRLFNNNDQLKTNTALQMKDAGIEFKVV